MSLLPQTDAPSWNDPSMHTLARHVGLLTISLSSLFHAAGVHAQPLSAPPSDPVVTAPATPPAPVPEARYVPIPGLRFGFGSRVPLNRAAGEDSGFAFDLAASLAVVRNETGVSFYPELGYAYDGSDTRGGHFFTAGTGLMYGSFAAAVGVTSRLVVGDSHRQFAIGVRNSLAFNLLVGALSLELGHQLVRAGGEDRHDFRWTISINPIPLVAAVVGTMALLRGVSATGQLLDTAIQHPGDLITPPEQRRPH